MGRENKKETVAAFHREQIITAAEKIFSEKGFAQTTINDISKMSEYSRRTIYSYYESKEDILHHIIAKGLLLLKHNIEKSINERNGFLDQYYAICQSMHKYQMECPHSLDNVMQAKTSNLNMLNLSPTVEQIFNLGTEINNLLASFIQAGKEQRIISQNVIPMQTVYVLSSSISSLLTLVNTKGPFIAKTFSISEEDFLQYGFKQIINSILEVRI